MGYNRATWCQFDKCIRSDVLKDHSGASWIELLNDGDKHGDRSVIINGSNAESNLFPDLER